MLVIISKYTHKRVGKLRTVLVLATVNGILYCTYRLEVRGICAICVEIRGVHVAVLPPAH